MTSRNVNFDQGRTCNQKLNFKRHSVLIQKFRILIGPGGKFFNSISSQMHSRICSSTDIHLKLITCLCSHFRSYQRACVLVSTISCKGQRVIVDNLFIYFHYSRLHARSDLMNGEDKHSIIIHSDLTNYNFKFSTILAKGSI